MRDLADGSVEDALPVAQNGNLVADVVDLFQVMGDVEDANSAPLEAANSLKQALNGGLLQ